MDYKEDLHIDKNNLDGEWLDQPKLVYKYGRELAQHEREVKKLNEDLKTLRSELINKATQEPTRYLGQGVKATGGSLEAYYRTHKKYKKLKKEVHDAELERDLVNVAYYAVQGRRAALDNLVRLHGQQYFSQPTGDVKTRALQKDRDKRVKRKRAKKTKGE